MSPSPPSQVLDVCDECGFDAGDWNDDDTITTIAIAPYLLRFWAEPIEPDRRSERPTAETWSPAEYADHVRETMFAMRFLVDSAVEEPGKDLGSAPDPAPAGEHRLLDFDDRVAAAGHEATLLRDRLRELSATDWDDEVLFDDKRHTVTWASRHALHDLWHHLTDISRMAPALGAPHPSGSGTLEQISASSGGVPKQALLSGEIDRRGLVGDRQALRRHHGRPWQALCLWSGDVIDALVAEGNPVHPGAAGENLTLRGLDWADMRAGLDIEVGSVRCRLSAPAVPCAKNNQWFADGDSRRIDHELHPGWSRWYASVLLPGYVSPDDPVTLSPPAAT